MRRRRWRILAIALVVVVMAGGSTYLWLRSSLPATSGTIALPGLTAEVTITRDAAGVPHIRAGDERDASFALGFVHAQDRLFQMDLMRRLGAGRLSEILGRSTLRTDELMRTLGLYRAAERQFDLLSEPLRRSLEAYAAGVNAFLAQRRALPPEYYMLAIEPEPWRPADSLVWAKYMALQLSGNYRNELLHARLATQVTPEQLAQLYPTYPSDAPVTLGALAELFRALPLDHLYAALPDNVGPTYASNNWVVDGQHTQSGKPLLANDPHLGFATPDVWYLARIDTPDLHLAGATAPGTPFVVIGHNDRIGWGFTTTESDVEDVFIERLDPNDPNSYLTPDGALPFETRQEDIIVRGRRIVHLNIRTTRHGPVISDLGGPTAPSGHVLALQATFLAQDDRTPQGLWDLARARDWQSFNAALENVTAPEQNIVYADVDGTIGFTAPARIPIRGKGDGWLPMPGWTGEYDWIGYVPFADLPRGVNPAEGRFVSANNKIVPDSYPYFISRDWDIPNRAQRITELLDGDGRQSADSSGAIQADTMSLMMAQVLPLLLRVSPTDERTTAAVALLRSWDGRMARDRAAPLIFTAWLRELNRALFEPRLGVAFGDYWGLRPLVLRNILTTHPEWCNKASTQGPEGCNPQIAASLNSALDELSQSYGSDMTRWRWGDAHQASFPHPLFDNIPVLRNLLQTRIPADGGSDTVNRGEMRIADPDEPFLDRHGAGLRMILDFNDLDASRFMIVPGESGNPLSSHYSDLVRPWRDLAWLTLGRDVRGESLVLAPK
ncbi:MAG: penicillin acylase/penicillin amidase [Rhodospirillales bacterium]|nr:penicillin acylase/penicillin amidase [Rhodospirillales bacterium]